MTIWVLAAASILAAAPFVSCQKQEQEKIELKLKQLNSDENAGNQFVFITASSDWTLTLEGKDGQTADWAWITMMGSEAESKSVSGRGDNSQYILNWAANTTSTQRSVSVVLRGSGLEQTVDFSQSAAVVPVVDPTEIKESVPSNCMELPEFKKSRTLFFISHDANISGKEVRNYALCWDTDNLLARWVAYPLNKWYIGTGSRTDKWGLDPNVPKALQPVLFRAFQGFGARGHQLPSADRLSYDANIQTFYGTNMTPQDYDFNSGMWANLEGAVRSWAGIFDTLYVVTGCVPDGSKRKAYDNEGKSVTVPVGYFKVLLGYAGASTTNRTRFSRLKDTGYYTGIAFYFKNENYSGHDYMASKMTITEIEKLTGFNFFVNLSKDYADKVENTIDSGWANNFK